MDMIYEDGGKAPRIAASSRIAPTAVISGDVTIGENCSIGYGVVITAESGPVCIGDNVVIMDTAVIRGIRSHHMQIADNVLIGPRAYLTGCDVRSNAFLATGVSIFNGAIIGERAEVRINGVVHIKTALAADATVPIGWVAVGDPAQIFPPDAHEQIWEVQKPLGFPKFVFGADRPASGESFMPEVMPKYAGYLSRRHRDG
jgi:carbonic anhydrase/acetyltransferase-like protein (isoleucine patch superfamily)